MKISCYFLLFFLFTGLLSAQWKQSNGPWEGNARCFIDVGTSIYAGTTDGIFVSTDNGKGWKPGSLIGLTSVSVRCFLKSGSDLFAGTDGGVFLSTNNGTNWFGVNTGINNLTINSLISFNSKIYAGTNGGVYITTDNGASWSFTSYNIISQTINTLLTAGTNMYAGTDQGVFKSTDNGNSWSSANFGLISQYVNTLFLDGSTIYAGTSAAAGAESIFKSTNNGTSWVAVGLTNQSVFSFIIYNSDLYAGSGTGIYRSSDNGTTWSDELGNIDKLINSLFSAGTNLIAGTPTDGILLSADGGAVWDVVGYKPLYIWSMDARGNDIWVTAAQHLIYHSTNNGLSWLSRTNGLNNAYRYTDIAITNSIIYTTYINNNLTKTGIYESSDNGENWYQTMYFSDRTINCVKAASDSVVYLGLYHKTGNYGIYRYKGPGSYQWGIYDEGVWDIAYKDSSIFAATFYNNIQRTTNNGLNWINTGIGGNRIVVSGDNIYASGTGVYRSTDDGVNWDTIGLAGENIMTLAVNPSIIIATVYNKGFFISSDNGETWSQRNEGLDSPPNNIPDIVINQGVIFASIDGKSIWERSIRDLVGVNEIDQVVPSAYILNQNYPNPFNPSTTISFNVPERSWVTLKIYDVLGKEIATLVSEEYSAGKHSVQWNAKGITSGVYFYQLKSGSFTQTRKLILMK